MNYDRVHVQAKKHAELLQDTPTKGRSIDWETLGSMEMPLFGANKGGDQPLIDPHADDPEFDVAAQVGSSLSINCTRLERPLEPTSPAKLTVCRRFCGWTHLPSPSCAAQSTYAAPATGTLGECARRARGGAS